MNAIYLIAIFVFSVSSIQAQKHDNIWLMGNSTPSARINYNNPSLTIDTVIKNMNAFRSCSSICDTSGSLLFYTNGIWVNNFQHQMMQNGDNLNPGQVASDFSSVGYPICNSSIIIPHPIQPNKYYLFHQSITYASDIAGFSEYLYYTLVDMNANGGLGRVVQKNQILASDSLCKGQLQAVKHANGRDWWLVQGKGWSNGFYTFLITGDTIILEHEQYAGDTTRTGQGYEWTGQAVFSPQGDKYVRYDYFNDLDIYDFDRCLGLLRNPIHIPIQDSADIITGITGGVAISSSGQYLYVGSFADLYQFDLLASNIENTKDTIAHVDNFYQFFPNNRAAFVFLQLAPNNKIYGVAPNTTYMHVIEYPDLGGTSCNVQQHNINTNFINGFFTPNHPYYKISALAGSPCDTLTAVAQPTLAQAADIKLYPNPASHSITLESSSPLTSGSIVAIYNTIGQEIFQQKIVQETTVLDLDIRSLIDGVYIVQIEKDRQRVSRVFVVSKK